MFKIFARKKLKKFFTLSKEGKKTAFIPYSQAARVILLYQSEQYQNMQTYIQNLENDHIKVISFILDISGKKNQITYPEQVNVLTSKNLKCGGTEAKNEITERFCKIEADAILNLTVTECLPLDFLCCISSVKQKMGFRKNGNVPYNFMIQSNVQITPEELTKNLLFYWKSIDIKNNNS